MPARKKAPGKKKAARKKAPAKPPARKAPAKRTAARKTAARKIGRRKPVARKAAARKAPVKKEAKAHVAKKPPAANKAPARSGISSMDVNLGHVFSLRPRVRSSFKQVDFVAAKQFLQDEAFASMGEAARAMELTHEAGLGRGPVHSAV